VKPIEVYEDGLVVADLEVCKTERDAYQAGYNDAIADAYAYLKATSVPEFYRLFLNQIGWKEPT
jgi:hypothetical protein